MTPDDLTRLRNGLAADRADVARKLAGGEPGFLPMLAHLHVALDALDAVQAGPMPPDAFARVALVDVPGAPLVLMVHRPGADSMPVPLDPLRALALAADLVEAARRRLMIGGVP